MRGVPVALITLRRWLALLLLPMLASCASIMLVPAYDEQIDAGLTALYGDTTEFVDRMIAARGTPAGTFGENRAFYQDAIARSEALVARAEAHRVLNNCPSTDLVAKALGSTRIDEATRGKIGQLSGDDCQVILMRLIVEQYREMATFHEGQEALGIPPSARGPLLDGGIGSLLRAALTVEIAKRGR